MTRPGFALRGALLLACALAGAPADAQVALSAAAASAAERAQKEADRTMYWIRVLATKPAPAKAVPAPVPPPRPVVATAPAARPVAEAHDKLKVAAATDSPANATNPAPARLALAQAPTLSQPPIASASDTSALSSNHADDVASGVADGAAPEAASPPEPDPGLSQVKLVQPEFPLAIVKRVHKGNVEVRFEVDPEGTVTDAVVVQSSNAHLDSAAIDAVRQWRFKPTPMSHTAAVNLVFDIDHE
ncbi:MAG: TonB family protein [Burkholderiales bacterium]|jgi:TonB family protein|nr:TonB family protein [Burkholderiales bacterium]